MFKKQVKKTQSDQKIPAKIPNESEVVIAALQQKLIDTESKLVGVLADYQNMLREAEKQREFKEAMLKKAVFADLIDLFTDLSVGVDQMPEELRKNSYVVGVVNIMKKYQDLMARYGVTQIEFKEGDVYDPNLAEVMGVISHAELDNKVAQMVQPGYRINEVLIKPACVLLYKKEEKK